MTLRRHGILCLKLWKSQAVWFQGPGPAVTDREHRERLAPVEGSELEQSPVLGQVVPQVAVERQCLGTTWVDFLLRLGGQGPPISTAVPVGACGPLPFFTRHWRGDHLKPLNI